MDAEVLETGRRMLVPGSNTPLSDLWVDDPSMLIPMKPNHTWGPVTVLGHSKRCMVRRYVGNIILNCSEILLSRIVRYLDLMS